MRSEKCAWVERGLGVVWAWFGRYWLFLVASGCSWLVLVLETGENDEKQQ